MVPVSLYSSSGCHHSPAYDKCGCPGVEAAPFPTNTQTDTAAAKTGYKWNTAATRNP